MRALREERGLSLRALEGRALSSRSRLSEYETGKALPSPDAAKRIDAALRADGALVAMLPRAMRVALAKESLEFSRSWPRAVEVTTGLWRGDMAGSGRLGHVAFEAAVFLTPAMRAMLPAEEHPVGDGQRHVDEPDVETIRRVTSTLRTLDNEYGGGHIRETAVRFLDADVAPLLHGRFGRQLGRSLFAATAELTQLAGWAAYDAGLHGLGQRYLIQALRLAVAAADLPLGAEILAAMSHQSAYLGAPAEAVDLARAAARLAADAGIPALIAEAAVLEAHGHAVGGDETACTSALTRAETALDKADRSRDPEWMGYFDEAYLSAKFGHCFSALGRGDLAERFARRSLDMDVRYVRGRQFNLALYATAMAKQERPQVDKAATVGIEAVEVAEGLRSARSVDYVARLAERLAPYCGLREVDEFNERAHPVLSR
jgi:transcriptional regulator with XRE-family HTH domain